ncbi:MAG: M42 family peptidase, partial [Ruminococcus sp.]|nr:M42 family peptidase [Ruminococcus sp.]
MYRVAFDTASELVIPCQTKSKIAGVNDSGAIHLTIGGVLTLAVSVPCRYLHSPSCVIEQQDFENTLLLVRELLKRVHEL